MKSNNNKNAFRKGLISSGENACNTLSINICSNSVFYSARTHISAFALFKFRRYFCFTIYSLTIIMMVIYDNEALRSTQFDIDCLRALHFFFSFRFAFFFSFFFIHLLILVAMYYYYRPFFTIRIMICHICTSIDIEMYNRINALTCFLLHTIIVYLCIGFFFVLLRCSLDSAKVNRIHSNIHTPK